MVFRARWCSIRVRVKDGGGEAQCRMAAQDEEGGGGHTGLSIPAGMVVRGGLRVEFLLTTDGGHPKDMGATLFTLVTPGIPLRYNTHLSAPPVSALAHSRGPRRRSQSSVSRTRTQRHVWTGPSL